MCAWMSAHNSNWQGARASSINWLLPEVEVGPASRQKKNTNTKTHLYNNNNDRGNVCLQFPFNRRSFATLAGWQWLDSKVTRARERNAHELWCDGVTVWRCCSRVASASDCRCTCDCRRSTTHGARVTAQPIRNPDQEPLHWVTVSVSHSVEHIYIRDHDESCDCS